MATISTKIGPADHGRRMSLDEFDRAEKQEGHLYELGRGIIIVSDVPNRRHLVQVMALKRQLGAYDLTHPGQIDTIASGSECQLLLPAFESERHPDLAVYKKPPKQRRNIWTTWVPEIAIEVISPGSEQRDYEDKREEYLQFGVREYWIVDADKEEVLVLRSTAGVWKARTIRPPQLYRTRVLPSFQLDCAKVFEAARAAEKYQ